MTEKFSPDQNPHLAETDRLEAFSDGVFAVGITLLVLEIHRPAETAGTLAQQLLQGWPSYLSYMLAFLYVGIIWINHHNLFLNIRKADLGLNACNLAGLSITILLPFPTGVMADAFRWGTFDDQRAAVVLYALVAGSMSAAWLPIFVYLFRHPELLKPGPVADASAAQMMRPLVGILSYVIAALLGWFVHPLCAIGMFIFMVFYHAWTCQGVRPKQ